MEVVLNGAMIPRRSMENNQVELQSGRSCEQADGGRQDLGFVGFLALWCAGGEHESKGTRRVRPYQWTFFQWTGFGEPNQKFTK